MKSPPHNVGKDTPECGYGIPVCEGKESAQTCVLNLKIDEIMTFTSYQKFKVGLCEGLAVRGTQGVIYNIDEKQEMLFHILFSKIENVRNLGTVKSTPIHSL